MSDEAERSGRPAADHDLHYLELLEAAQLVQQRQISAVELAEAQLCRIAPARRATS